MQIMQSKQAASAKTSLVYLTIGALTVIWSVIYYLYLERTGASNLTYLWCYGFFFSGLVLIVIGLAVGHIGRSAMRAEVAPPPNIAVTPTPTTVVETVEPPVPSAAAPVVPAPAAPAPGVAIPVNAPAQTVVTTGSVPVAPASPARR